MSMFHRVRALAAASLFVIVLVHVASAHAAETLLYRIFLIDGSVLVSFGEYARVADRVVVPIPVGSSEQDLQIVSLAESSVDWEQTDRYANAVRAKRYGDTRGPDEFALLTGRVVEALNQVALMSDPARRLVMAEEARRNLMQWPEQNFGYRAADVAQFSTLFDEVIADLRAAAGLPTFDFSLVSTSGPGPSVELLPDPDFRGMMEQALAAARLTPESSERLSLLRSITSTLRGSEASWAAALAMRASAELTDEMRIEDAYKKLSVDSMAAARATAARADVRGLQAIVRRVLQSDDRLGRHRPQETSSLLAMLDMRLDEARRLRLARDAWNLRIPMLEEYRRAVAPAVGYLLRSKAWLDDIRQLAGPAPISLSRLEQRIVMGRQALARVTAPPEVESVHGLYTAAFQMARRAASERRSALSSTNMTMAWDAASAAAGALMMIDRAADELTRLIAAPRDR